MAKITFTKLGLKPIKNTKTIALDNGVEIEVKEYLPIAEKIELINYVVENALDEKTGCFSPVRTEVYFSIGVAKWYGNISFTEKQMVDIDKTYDALETNGVLDKIMGAIPSDELEFLKSLIDDTTTDIARYNSSFAGVVTAASGEAGTLDDQINKIMESVKNREGLEVLGAVKDVVGID